ncbi:MAG: DNA polymerase III subunit beta [Deltaproteobacteria bacterium]|jgi:DNA polymerase-3 subunit beta|nr:DNA polymerase III subunit beta [Deltaproteobacteria bacterium]
MLKVKVKKEEFQKGLAQTSNIAGKFTSMPILSNVLVEASDGKLSLTATDLEITFQASYEAEVDEEGRITVPAKTLSEIVHSLGDEYVTLTEKEQLVLEVKTETFRGDIFGLSPEDFPRIAPVKDVPMATFSTDSLIDAIGKTIYSVAANTTNFNLSGIYWIKENKDDEGETVRLVSSDSNRLNVATLLPADIEKFQPDMGVLISRKALSELKALAEGSGSVQIGVNINQLAAATDEAVLIMRLLDGKFPDYNGLLPPPPTMSVELNRRLISETLRRMNPFTTLKFRVIFFRFSQDSIHITTENPELGKAEDKVSIDYSGPEITVGFDPRHLLDALGSLRSERFRLKYVDLDTPVVLTADDDPGWLCIVSTISPKEAGAQ